jgi:short-subunit dehydrogenase
MERLAQTVIDRFGRIDTWVNNAGVSIYGRLDEVSDSDSRKLFDTNFWGVVNGSLAALPHLRKQGGALINVGSEASDAVVPLQGMYSASKHAVKGFTDALRVELGEIDDAPVSITLIQPTAVDTRYPQHAKNYMDSEPKLPTPQIGPEKVAEDILDAAAKPERDVRVGAMSVMNTIAAKVMPSAADRVSANRRTASNTTSRRAIPTERYGRRAARGWYMAAADASSEADLLRTSAPLGRPTLTSARTRPS